VNALLDFIEANTDPSNPAQVHAREWSQRVRELQKRQAELLAKELVLVMADDLDGFDAAAVEYDAVTAELSQVCHRLGEFVSRLRTSTNTKQ
jgi:hypothetical protein